MIKVEGNNGKSFLFEKILKDSDTLGIILGEKSVPWAGRAGDVYIYVPSDPEAFCEVLSSLCVRNRGYKWVILYSNFSEREMKPYEKLLENLEKELHLKIVFMYKEK